MAISYEPVNFESISVGDTAVGLTASLRAGMTPNSQVFITVEGGAVRYRMDATAPTAIEGHKMVDGDSLVLEGRGAIDNFKAIKVGADNGTLRCSYLQG